MHSLCLHSDFESCPASLLKSKFNTVPTRGSTRENYLFTFRGLVTPEKTKRKSSEKVLVRMYLATATTHEVSQPCPPVFLN